MYKGITMKQTIFLLLIFTLLAADYIPSIEQIPPEYKVIRETSGDLTGDGLADSVRILHWDGDENNEESRILQVFENTKNGSYRLLVENENALMLSSEGGVMGDPLDGISIKNNSLFITFYGGSGWRWGITFQFLKRNGVLSLVGKESESFHTGSGETTKESTNYLSGKKQIRERKINHDTGKLQSWTERWEKPGRKPLISLSDFVIEEHL